MTNPNDQIRDTILRHLYQVHRKAASPRSAPQGIRDLTTGLRVAGLKRSDVSSNLDYLVQKGWAVAVIEHRTFTTQAGTTQNSQSVRYKISDLGIDRIEAASMYKREDVKTQINITNIKGVTVLGDGNVVNASFSAVAPALNELRQAISKAPNVPEEDKLNALSDIDGLQAQMQKPSPSPVIVDGLWSGIEKVAALAGAADLVGKVAALLSPLVLR